MKTLLPLLLLGPLACAIVASASAESLPVPTGERAAIDGGITPAGDVDSFGLNLLPGDRAVVKVRERGPTFQLETTLTVTDPDGIDAGVTVKRQSSSRPSLKLTAEKAGTHVVSLAGGPGEFSGATGNYSVKTSIKRSKVKAEKLSAPPGGDFAIPIGVTDGALLTLKLTAKKGGADIVGLFRPDGTAEPGFLDALKVKKRARYQAKKFPVTGGFGVYELRGSYDAGAVVKVKSKVRHDRQKLKSTLAEREPRFDPALPPFPDEGVPLTTQITVVGQNLVNETVGETVIFPTFTVGGITIAQADIENPLGQVYRFPAPAGLPIGESFDITVRNPDGQGDAAIDGFTHPPLAEIFGLTEDEVGPAGGREFRILGENLRAGSTVLVDGTVVAPDFVISSRMDVVAPPHAPGEVPLTIRDDFGRLIPSPTPLTYLDIGSNRITDVSPARLQGVGGQTVTVTGADFTSDTTLSFGGTPVDSTLVSPTEMTFQSPDHAGGPVAVKVEDSYQQASSFEVETVPFTDVSDAAVPTPNEGDGVADGWRATRVLVGLIDGDATPDLVLVRPAAAFGGDVQRSRVRVLLGDGAGGYTDATNGIPDVSSTDDWRAVDAALADVDGLNGLDIVLLTDDTLDDGARSSLRVLLNDGTGTFTDGTAAAMPAETAWGDHNQGYALAIADVDGQNGPDIVVAHDTAFSETIDLTPPVTDPENPPAQVLITNHYTATRVFLNDGSGAFTRDQDALPALDDDSFERFEATAVAITDIDGVNGPDIVLSADAPREDPATPGTFLRRAVLLVNDGSGTFTDDSAARLPGTSSPDYLHGDRVEFIDHDSNGTPDLVISSNTRLVDPGSGSATLSPALRIYSNDGTGNFSRLTAGTLARISGDDALQCERAAFGDVTGDGRADIVLVSARAPTTGGHAARILIWTGSAYEDGTDGLPDPVLVDDGRGADTVLHDVDGDGDLDVIVVRDEPDETARNTRIYENPRIE